MPVMVGDVGRWGDKALESERRIRLPFVCRLPDCQTARLQDAKKVGQGG